MSKDQPIQRFNLSQRLEHLVLTLSFTTLVLTGIPQKFAQVGLSQSIIGLLGGIERTRNIHHIAATVFLLETVYHLVALGYSIFVRRSKASMLPTFKDVKDGVQAFAYNLGLAKSRPKLGHFSWDEKMEYWALVWGLLVMSATGFMMWNPIATTSILPGVAIPVAKTVHGWEAILAALAILTWHFYHVLLRHLNLSIFTGNLSHEEMVKDHPLELVQIASERSRPAVSLAVFNKKRRIYFPIAAVFSLVLLFGVYQFVTFEKSAVPDLPPAETVTPYFPETATPALVAPIIVPIPTTQDLPALPPASEPAPAQVASSPLPGKTP
jgi:cytochrome b subunit of formate dehydrogenase